MILKPSIAYQLLSLLIICLWFSRAIAAGPNFNDTNNKAVTGDSSPNFTVNVGISSTSPGQKLDVQGTVRTIGVNLSTSPVNGYVLTSDASGNGAWAASAGGGGWTKSSSNVTTPGSNNVGIGTTSPQDALVVTNGNVGIGTWPPTALFQVGLYRSSSSGLQVDSNGNIGLGTTLTTTAALTVMNGNVGIGTWKPSGALDIKTAGNVLIQSGNVGIGSVTPGQTLDVNGAIRSTVSGNVGIGTPNPGAGLEVGTGLTVRFVGVGTTIPQRLCRKADGTVGYFNGTWASTCTSLIAI